MPGRRARGVRSSLIAAGLMLAAGACGAWRPTGSTPPPAAALVEVELTPPRDVAALTSAGDTLWLRQVTMLTGRTAAGSTGDTLVLAPDGMRRAGGGRDALPRGLQVRLPRNRAAGVRLHVERPGMRPDMLIVGVALGTLAGIGLYVGFGL